jgi:hypothetical protein
VPKYEPGRRRTLDCKEAFMVALVMSAADEDRLFRRVAAPVPSAVQVVDLKEEAVRAPRNAAALSIAAQNDAPKLGRQRSMIEPQRA